MSGLVERLREDHNSIWQPLMDEAADEITRLTARVAELEGALEPFADVDGEGDEGFPDDTQAVIKFGRSTHYAVHLGDFRRARAALEPKP